MLIAIIILVFLFLLICVVAVYLFDAAFGGIDFVSNSAVALRVAQILKQRHVETGNFYDLGSCRGSFALKIGKMFPKLSVLGLDDSRYRTFFAKIRAKFLKNVKFSREDIFKSDVSPANVVYLYLPQELMPDLQNKLQKELTPGSLVVSHSVSFPAWQPVESFILNPNSPTSKKLFVYVKA